MIQILREVILFHAQIAHIVMHNQKSIYIYIALCNICFYGKCYIYHKYKESLLFTIKNHHYLNLTETFREYIVTLLKEDV